MDVIPNRPYLIRAIYNWVVDNQWTPHFQIDADYPNIQIPRQFVENSTIVLNVDPSAVRQLELNNDNFFFKARFQGVEQEVFFPPEAVIAVFARENGQGMPFPKEPYPADKKVKQEKPIKKKPHLSIVK
jgi:stringent starvation protein B